jgi:hypothetical protein
LLLGQRALPNVAIEETYYLVRQKRLNTREVLEDTQCSY